MTTRVLVTGATGFIGSYVVRSLAAEKGVEVSFLARPSSDTWRIREVLPYTTRIDAELGGGDALRSAVAKTRPDVLVHLAWKGVGSADRNAAQQIENLADTLALLRAARAAGARAFVGLGSQAEYGPSSGALDETAPTQPTTLYGVTKLSTCHFTRHACGELGMRYAWIRVFSTYGAMDNPSWMIPSLVLQLLARKKPPLTLGEQRWDYLHVSDAADAIARVALGDAATGVFNLGSGEAHTIRSIVEKIRDTIDPSLPLGFGEVPYRPDQVMHLEAQVDRLRQLGWRPAMPLDRGIRETVAWYRDYGGAGAG
jgi:UDP-glucose 4-epimerase